MKRSNCGNVIGSTMAIFLMMSGASASALDFDLNDYRKEGEEVPAKVVASPDFKELPVESLFEPFYFRPIDLREEPLEKETLRSQVEGGGLSMAIAHALTWPNAKGLKLKWNGMTFDIDDYNRSAVLDVTALKSLTENGVTKDIKFRWVIAIKPGGLRTGRIKAGEMTYMIYATGKEIEIITFEVDGKPVKYFEDDGRINRLAKVYSPNDNDCIDIKVRVEIDNDGTIKSPSPDDLNFCAGSCSGYLLAATR